MNKLINEVVGCQTVFGAIISSYLKGVHKCYGRAVANMVIGREIVH